MNDSCADDIIGTAPNIYFHSYSINEHFKISPTEMKQYQFSTHTGILVRRSTSYLIYATTPAGLFIQPRAALRTRTYAGMFLARNRLTKESTTDAVRTGIVFCKNEREFKKMFERGINESINDPSYTLSRIFLALYAIPVTRDGVYLLDTIFYYHDKGTPIQQALIASLMDSYTGYERTGSSLCPLRYGNREVYIGIEMNLAELQRFILNTMSECNRDNTYILLCYEWQKPYYERIVSDKIELVIVPDSIV